MGIIRIENMKFYAYHGCFEEEQTIGTRFMVNVTLNTDTRKAQRTDNIEDTVNYLSVYQVVKTEMLKPSHLLEHVAERIGSAVLEQFPAVDSMIVRVSKMNPPLGGQMDCVSVEIEKSRN